MRAENIRNRAWDIRRTGGGRPDIGVVGEFGVWQAAQHMENARVVRSLGMLVESSKSIRENRWETRKRKDMDRSRVFSFVFIHQNHHLKPFS